MMYQTNNENNTLLDTRIVLDLKKLIEISKSFPRVTIQDQDKPLRKPALEYNEKIK